MAPKKKNELEAFVEALRHGNAAEREEAAVEIGLYGIRPLDEDAALAVSALIEALSDEESDVRYEAGQALMFLEEAAFAAIPELLRVFTEDEDSWVRESALAGLSGIAKGGLGPYNAQAVPLLLRALQDESEGIRGNAAVTLGRLVLPDPIQLKDVIAALEKTAEDSREDKGVRLVAYKAIEQLQPEA